MVWTSANGPKSPVSPADRGEYMKSSRKEQLEDAFKAYSAGVMSDAQLKLAHEATSEMVETMFAMGLSGPPVLGFVLQEQSLRGYINSRKRS